MVEKTIPSSHLKNRRQALRSQRRSKGWQGMARFAVVSGLASGLAWGMISPDWVIRKAEQVTVKGTRSMSAESIRSFLDLSYPLSIWEFPTDRLDRKLTANPAIAAASIERQLLPPKAIVTIRERQPIARARLNREEGFLDAGGIFIPKRYYDRSSSQNNFPTLEIIGYDEQYQTHWREIYPLIRDLSVKISAIDWRDPSNLVLKTELGKVYLGAYDNRLSEKLIALVQSRQLSAKIPLAQILYIDLSDPEAPTVQLKPKPVPIAAKPTSKLR